ncbi:fumarylacetoacetate hydrolase family protein [Jatrophihabitans sp.]|uniref:fumarylacetoacetate hydrolase family protein n=1 Tax=Jatrophihabitans sp. TaxID=1932789 RepID=UPI0030C73442|nr:fumarylacetoacetase [Jatrophihabitans sp.]
MNYGSALYHGRRIVVGRVGDAALDLTAASLGSEFAPLFADGSLDALLAAGRPTWQAVHAAAASWAEHDLIPLEELTMLLPFTVADYVDFYASEQHATNVGRIFRPDGDALTPNWKHLPIGYHGRAGTVVVSGVDVVRPSGQAREPDGSIRFGPSRRLDIEAEVGFVVGTPSRQGIPVPIADFAEHVFGVCLVNDWSARDIQSWEYVPLGPFLGKSFATSISAWITPLDDLDAAWTAPPVRNPAPLPYLDDSPSPAALDLALEVRLNGELISRPPFAGMYWTPPQLLAHLTVNGASLRTGDLIASGTVSGPERDQRGSLLELSWNGTEPLQLAGGERSFLLDGDEVTITATALGREGPITLGEVTGRIVAQPATP